MDAWNRFDTTALRRWTVALLVATLGATTVFSSVATAQSGCLEPPGDVTQNGGTDIVDVQCAIIAALYTLDDSSPFPTCLEVDFDEADLNCDGVWDVTDIVLVITYALGGNLDASVDADGNQCPDVCEAVEFDCGDGVCTPGVESCLTCPQDCEECAGDCCGADGTPGCDIPACAACVCADDIFCCDTGWDDLCVVQATEGCGAQCNCQVQDCCEGGSASGCNNPSCEDCVCEDDSFCCDTTWDSLCTNAAATTCNGVCLCDTEDCCIAGDGAGCANPTCEECVCGDDPFCCETLWDDICVTTAVTDCDAACQCNTAPGEGSCCATNDGPGCDDLGCQQCVCGDDPFCCELSWDSQCLTSANTTCTDACECAGGGDTGADCCAANDGPGCDDSGCSSCVCAVFPSCCSTLWDESCTDVAGSFCEPACGCGGADCCQPQNGAAGCGETSCESCVCGIDSFCCDIEWDDLCAAAASFDCAGSCSCE